MFCSNCGREIKQEETFCPFCRAEIEKITPLVKTTSGFAIASLVLGIVGVFGVCSILAIIFGVIARNRIRESNETIGGEGMAIAGIVLGIVTLAIFVIWLIIIIGIGVTNP